MAVKLGIDISNLSLIKVINYEYGDRTVKEQNRLLLKINCLLYLYLCQTLLVYLQRP